MTWSELYTELRKYTNVNNKKSVIQLINSIVPYLGIIVLMYWLLANNYSYWIILPLAIINAGFLARIFIIFHDCTHGAFFKSRRLCHIVGHVCGILAFTAFRDWRYAHLLHHATSSNLDKRGHGDIKMMTLKEYYASSKLKKYIYRLYRNPFFLFIIAPPFKFIILNRIPNQFKWNKNLVSQIITTGALLLIFAIAWKTIGIRNYFLIQIPIISTAGSIGIWLFYVQHQFQNAYWSRTNDWDPLKAAMHGASFYNLPPVLRWFTGSIGYHHIHHLLPNIPNYNLKKCYDGIEEVRKVNQLTLRTGFRSFFLKLYNEESHKLISFREASELMRIS